MLSNLSHLHLRVLPRPTKKIFLSASGPAVHYWDQHSYGYIHPYSFAALHLNAAIYSFTVLISFVHIFPSLLDFACRTLNTRWINTKTRCNNIYTQVKHQLWRPTAAFIYSRTQSSFGNVRNQPHIITFFHWVHNKHVQIKLANIAMPKYCLWTLLMNKGLFGLLIYFKCCFPFKL